MTSKIFLYSIFLMLSIIGGKQSLAQQPYFIQYAHSEGLPTNMIYDVFQDSRGYIWVSTDVGVSRFDGQEFTNFSTEDGLTDNEVFNMFEDSKGRIWFSTYNGSPCFYYQNEFFNAQKIPALEDGMVGTFITNYTETATGEIFWMGIKNGIVRMDTSGQVHFVRRFDQNNLESLIPVPGSADVLVASNLELRRVSPDGSAVRIDTFGPRSQFIRSAFTDHHIFLCDGKKMYIGDRNSGRIQHKLDLTFLASDIIRCYTEGDYLWLGTRTGVYRLNFEKPGFQQIKWRRYLEDYSVSGIIKDREGGMWFSTLEAGLYFAPSHDALHLTEADGLPAGRIYCLEKDALNRLWLGASKNQFARLDATELHNFKIDFEAERGVTNIRHFSREETFIASKGISIWMQEDSTFKVIQPVGDIYKDSYDQYWLWHWGVARFSKADLRKISVPEHNDYDYFEIQDTAKSLLKKNKVMAIRGSQFAQVGRDTMWIGSIDGLYWFHFGPQRIIAQAAKPVLPYRIKDLTYDSLRKILWVATNSHGLYGLQNKEIKYHFTNRNGLLSNICNAVYLEQADGHLYLGTVKGLNQISFEDGHPVLRNLTSAYGLREFKINDIESWQDQIYLATENGLTLLDKNTPVRNPAPPLIYLDAFLVDGQSGQANTEIAYQNNSVTFHFTGLNYRDQGQLSYRYRLLGQDDEWLQTKARQIHFRSLRPGKYTFEVQSENRNGVRSLDVQRYYFEVLPPFWQQPWFVLGMVILLITGTIYFYRQRLHRYRQKYAMEQKLTTAQNEKLQLEKQFLDLEMRALRLQMNPHFLFNALNTIKGYYAENRIAEANSYITKFAKLLRLIIEDSDKYIPLERELKLLEFYLDLSKIRYPGKFDYRIHIEGDIQQDNAAIPPMLLQPFVENAILHGLTPLDQGPGRLDIRFAREGGRLVASVSDNGIGRKAASRIQRPVHHRSRAIEITRERLRIIHQHEPPEETLAIIDHYTDDGSAAGTEVIIRTPFKTIW